jgi:hypothetical protein
LGVRLHFQGELHSCYGENQSSSQKPLPIAHAEVAEKQQNAASIPRRYCFVTKFTEAQNPALAQRFNIFLLRHPSGRARKTGKIMKLHLISGAVLLYTLLTLAAICLAELGATSQNVPF